MCIKWDDIRRVNTTLHYLNIEEAHRLAITVNQGDPDSCM